MADDFDLDAYLARIGYEGPREPTRAVLQALHARQVDAIPFENLTPLAGEPVLLDLASLQAKMVAQRRGGYCFELNGLFKAALEAIGFAVTGLAGRVRWMAPPERPDGALNHMAMRVDLDDGPWLADVGFGGHLMAGPIRLTPEVEQTTPAGVLRLVPHGPSLTLQTRFPDGWRDLYRFKDEAQSAADYEVFSWHTSAHPSSIFRSLLIAERLAPERRVSIVNRRLTERFADGRVVERALAGPADLRQALEEELGVAAPAHVAVLFARLPASDG
jgi:N-hydroxyarylamine O-acetyltransferase